MLLEFGVEKHLTFDIRHLGFSTPISNSMYSMYILSVYAVRIWGTETFNMCTYNAPVLLQPLQKWN